MSLSRARDRWFLILSPEGSSLRPPGRVFRVPCAGQDSAGHLALTGPILLSTHATPTKAQSSLHPRSASLLSTHTTAARATAPQARKSCRVLVRSHRRNARRIVRQEWGVTGSSNESSAGRLVLYGERLSKRMQLSGPADGPCNG